MLNRARRIRIVALMAAIAGCTLAALETPTIDPADAGYVNPKQCQGCHAAIYNTYMKTGMGRSFGQPRAENTLEDYSKNNRFTHALSNTSFEMVQREGNYYQRRYQTAYNGTQTNVDETRIDYFLGSADHARAYLHRNADGGLVQLPLVWYSEKGGHWGMAPGYDTATHPFGQRPITYDCLFCHNAYEAIPANHTRLGDEPIFSGALPEGIDCQRCHGPGKSHVVAATTAGTPLTQIRSAIVNPARLNADRQAEVCYQCHLQTTGFALPHSIKRYERPDYSYKPGEPLGDFQISFGFAGGGERDAWFQNVSTATRMRMSQCFLKSNGALNCTTCHNPHDVANGKEAAAHYNGICRQCHAASFNKLVASGKHTAQTGCTACHMPQRRPMEVVHIAKTDHYIQRNPQRAELLTELTEFHETQANSYRGKVFPYYPNPLPKTPENDLYLALAQVRDKSNPAEGIPQLVRAIESSRAQRPEPWYELGAAWQATGQTDRAIAAYRESLRRDASFPAAWLGLGAAFRQAGELPQAADAFSQAVKTAPDNAKAWNELGQADLDLNRGADAMAAFRQAGQLPQAHNGIGVLLAQGGDFPGAEKEFREAIRILPNYGEAHGNLAGVLDLESDLKQALYEFDLAVRLNPADSSARFNYGAVLSRERRVDEARAQFEGAVLANPQFAEAHEMLGRLDESAGRLTDALREYQAAVRIQPGMGQAQLDLGAVLAKTGDKAGALEHLRLAAASPDARLRDIANQLLRQVAETP